MTHQSECVKPTNCPTFDSLADTIIVGIPEGQDGNVTKHPNSAPHENIEEAIVRPTNNPHIFAETTPHENIEEAIVRPTNNPHIFAETDAELVKHTCTTNQELMKLDIPDFYTLYAATNSTKYSDPKFLPD